MNYLSLYSSIGFSYRFMNPSSYMAGNFGRPEIGRAANENQFSGLSGTKQPSENGQISGQLGTEKTDNRRKIPGQPDLDTYECQTCKNRKYQDGSDDPGVSFKTPTRISPERAAYAVRAHESEHVAHAWAEAQKENKEIVSQTVSYKTDICPECGKSYISGGNTRTVFRSSPETYNKPPVQKGAYVDLMA